VVKVVSALRPLPVFELTDVLWCRNLLWC